jgi:hypothetical protein
METQMGKNRLMGPNEEKENEILRAGNKKRWMAPRLVKIDASRSTKEGPAEGLDGPALGS